MKTHPTFPDGEDLKRVFEIKFEIIEENIANPSSSKHSKEHKKKKVIEFFR
jgi:hypothetical protein